MTPTIDAPSYAYTDLQTSTVCVEEDLKDQEEKYKHAGPKRQNLRLFHAPVSVSYLTRSGRPSSLMTFTECIEWKPNFCSLFGSRYSRKWTTALSHHDFYFSAIQS